MAGGARSSRAAEEPPHDVLTPANHQFFITEVAAGRKQQKLRHSAPPFATSSQLRGNENFCPPVIQINFQKLLNSRAVIFIH